VHSSHFISTFGICAFSKYDRLFLSFASKTSSFIERKKSFEAPQVGQVKSKSI
jgi:hypothetical protein